MAKKKAHPITFELFAPYNESVKLLGDWNDWQPVPMKRNDAGVWQAEVALSDGNHQYKFEVVSQSPFAHDQMVTVADPKAVEFTLDSHENSIIKIKDGKPFITTYQWKHDDVPLPPNEKLIIYELHVGDFRGGPGDSRDKPGDFQSMIEKLDYLVDLGINAVELMPINEFPGHYSWGYSARSIYAVENSYGSPDDLCELVDECHARGIRVILDAVYNHMESDAPLTQIDYNYWFYEINPDGNSELDFGPKFNYEHYDSNLDIWPAREHVMGAMQFWLGTFHVDGIRFDATRAIRYFDLMHWFNNEMHKREGFKPFYTIAEHIPQDTTITGPDGPMDAAWHDHFYRQLNSTTLGIPYEGRNPFDTSEVLRILGSYGDGFASPYNTIHYINNHDQNRTMFLLGEAANTFDDAAFRRNKLGATLLLTAPGIPMLWMGEEFGQATPRNIESHPLEWSLLDNERNQGLWNHYAHLIHLRKSNPALTNESYEIVADMPGRGIIAFKRWNDEGNVILVVANLMPQYAGEFEVSNHGLDDGTWHESNFNYDVQVEGGRLVDTLAESEAKIYIKCS